eukprot:TRINITY_DN3152_c0_g1_i1.p1 TRINITY_DN3152_c0_g1~~TRINITY_DN3152_c0_g1_i1.p1  ORF type:complete len:686 (-),score=68.69 TRINITY_DN3152_c0_g1_i1:162-2219(-)
MADKHGPNSSANISKSRYDSFVPSGAGRWVRSNTPELAVVDRTPPDPEVDAFAVRESCGSNQSSSVAAAAPRAAARVLGETHHSFTTSLCAGAVAGLSVDLTLYPLDTLRARLQAPAGFVAAGGFSSLYRGIGIALVGSAPCSAIFFGTFEAVKAPVGNLLYSTLGFQSQVTTNAISALFGELTASFLRAPVEMFKQRQQTHTVAQRTSLYVGWKATLVRDLPFSTIQYPLYNVVKGIIGDYRQRPLDPWQAALCGSATSAVAAALTTPLDLVQTRLMLDTTNTKPKTVSGMLFRIYSEEGVPGFFRGVFPRSLWMGLGGLIFLGTYEQAKVSLEGGHDVDRQEAGMSLVAGSRLAAADAAATVPMDASGRGHGGTDGTNEVGHTGAVALLSGALAGFAIDGFLHPIDTLKARSMSLERRQMAFSFRSFLALWEGLGAALLPAIPASAVFFTAYETLKKGLEQNRLFRPRADDGVPNALACSCVAAGVAEGFACLLRVPAESMKMRLQAGQDATFGQAFRRCYANGGARAFYRGLGATLLLDVPFALLQYPIYEAAKNYFAERRLILARSSGNAIGSTQEAAPLSVSNLIDGALSGAVAGAIAGCVTTPLDVVRTRHVLSPLSRESLGTSFLDTAQVVLRTDGVPGLFRGCIPRTVYMCIGGAVYLGTYTACDAFLTPLLKDAQW